MRGEFRFANGLVIPNNVTISGKQEYLRRIFRGEVSGDFYFGLCATVPAPNLDLAAISLTEPVIGQNGYSRISVTADEEGFPEAGVDAAGAWIESQDLTFTAVGGPFSRPITRLFLTPESDALVGEVWALSAALPILFTIEPETELENRTFRYRLYL